MAPRHNLSSNSSLSSQCTLETGDMPRRGEMGEGVNGYRGGMMWEEEPSSDALILSQGLPNLTATICIWEEWITIPRH